MGLYATYNNYFRQTVTICSKGIKFFNLIEGVIYRVTLSRHCKLIAKIQIL